MLCFLAMAFLLFSCAQVVPLTGGEKDEVAPKEVESTPINGAINFVSKNIVVEFDEFIKLTNISNQLIVSPLMETPPEIIIKGKKIVIKIQSELAENTTYSLNFGNAISDITENNVFPNYKYVFSTGTYVDSLSYSGTVINAFDLAVKENIYILLYDQFEDSIPYKELPRYVALTDKEGEFSITNIANGKYKFFAINDINSNYLFDLPNEEIGFQNNIITLDSSSSHNHIYLFEEESDLQYVVKAENKTYGKIDIILNQPTENLIITPLNVQFKKQWYLQEKNEKGDSITLWLTTTEGLENLELFLKDSVEIIDTVEIDIINKTEFKDTLLYVSTNITSRFDLNKKIELFTNRPIKNSLVKEIQLFEDSVLIKDSLVFSEILVGFGNKQKTTLEYTFKENTNYQLFIPPSTFEDIYGLKNDTIKIDFKTKNESDYGIINLTINPNFSEKYIVQLYKNKKLISENYLTGNQNKKYSYLNPGTYSLKLIIDKNGDKKWNTGNYLEGLQPEKVIFYEKEIKIRANWDNDIVWTIKE